ncbi:hypothetical protein [Oligella urethralis]|uniref:hypothetical protein n=1 Tax=Oligella urethralis TaxID=90245 RepID=UPI000E01FBEA|nr:hypothetical protein [Oligella urethralis]SUA58013.1 Uncharacterised protein [Oligella urethralis]
MTDLTNSNENNTQEVTLQVRFPVEVLNKIEWHKQKNVLGGELVAIDFGGAAFREWQERWESPNE